jgi:hypothetical protein
MYIICIFLKIVKLHTQIFVCVEFLKNKIINFIFIIFQKNILRQFKIKPEKVIKFWDFIVILFL